MRARWILILLVLMAAAAGFFPFESDVPAQPIDFPHRIHAGVNQIPCQYCHTGARRSPFAGLPLVERCMGCHKIVATDKPEIAKLAGYFERGESIPWIRMFSLPDFVFFNHQPHLMKKLACRECHGPVETYDRFREFAELQMGCCLDCHHRKGGPAACLTCHR